MSPQLLATFVLASVLLALAPGPDNIFVLTQSALHGRKAGLFITLGLCTGLVVHTMLVAFGVAAILMASATAFLILKIAGATYLAWLAIQAWRASARVVNAASQAVLSPQTLYLRGIVMNLANPKVALFFLAFLPQFVRPELGQITMQLVVLGMLFMVSALLVFSLVAIAAGHLAGWFLRSRQARVVMQRITAGIFAGLASRLALSSRQAFL